MTPPEGSAPKRWTLHTFDDGSGFVCDRSAGSSGCEHCDRGMIDVPVVPESALREAEAKMQKMRDAYKEIKARVLRAEQIERECAEAVFGKPKP